MKIHFVWMDDGMDCETCGGGYADGGQVYIDDVLVVDMQPVAHCYDSVRFSQSEIYYALYQAMGLTELYAKVGETARISHDDREFWLALEELGHTLSEEEKSLSEPYDYYDDDDESYVEDEQEEGATSLVEDKGVDLQSSGSA